MTDQQDIADALLHPEHQDEAVAKITLRYAVEHTIMCAYCGHLLDVRESVLIDGSDDGGRMDLLHGWEFDAVIAKSGGLEALQERLGYQVKVYDGRELFGAGVH